LGVFPVGFAVLTWQWKLAPTFGAFCHAALNYGGTSSAGEGSAVAYVEGEAASWTAYDVFCLGHCITFVSVVLNEFSRVLKTFLERGMVKL